MAAVLGIWIGLAGVLPVLAGLTGIRRVQRLRREGVKSWAVAEPEPPDDGARRMTLRYTLADGRVLEQSRMWPARKITALRPGQSVLIWYDPADPLDILVYGRQGRVSDLMFVIGGAALILFGAVIGIFAPLLAGYEALLALHDRTARARPDGPVASSSLPARCRGSAAGSASAIRTHTQT
jgi:hypothetical protein